MQVAAIMGMKLTTQSSLRKMVRMQVSTSFLRQRQTAVRFNWGFRFALWCALLWAVGYQGLDLIVHNGVLLGNDFADTSPYLVGLAIAVVFTVLLTIVSLVWVGANHGLRDWINTVTKLDSSNLLLLLSAIVGGGVALVSYVITFQMDSGFAVAMVMFYSSVGAIMARFWYREKISRKCILGLVIIALGCLFLYLSESGLPGRNLLAVLGMGVFAGMGWGVEGALAARAMDVVDSNIAMSVRFTYEAVIWLLVFVLDLVLGGGADLAAAVGTLLSSHNALLMLVLVALCIHFDYLCWYKSFLYCGVSGGLSVSTISSAITVVIGLALMTIIPSYLAIVAFALMAIGIFLVFSGQDNRFATLRDVNVSPSSIILLGLHRPESLALKTRVLVEIAERGRCWDYELAASLVADQNTRRGRHLVNKLRLYLVEAQASGLIIALDEREDDGSRFAPGKLLSNYALTEFGSKRLQGMRLVMAEEQQIAVNDLMHEQAREEAEQAEVPLRDGGVERSWD